MSTSSVLPTHEASVHPVPRALGTRWRPLGNFLNGMIKEAKPSNWRFSVSTKSSGPAGQPNDGGAIGVTLRRGSTGEFQVRGRRGSLADSLLSSLRATPPLSSHDEFEDDRVVLKMQPACKEKHAKHRMRDFIRKVTRNSERSGTSSVIDLSSSFDEFRRALSITPEDYSDAFKEQGREMLGEGANGRVFSFKGTGQKRYAVKIFAEEVQDVKSEHNMRLYRTFMREAVISSVLSHAFCGVTHDVGFFNGHLALVMEHYPMNFVRLVNSGKVPALRLNHHFRQLIAAVHYLHENGIAHRDLKLENLCLSHSSELKIIDFGNAVLFEPPGPTLCSDVVGTDRYIAPEVILGGMYDAVRAESWSLGILYLAMLFRKLPWPLPHVDQPTYHEFLKNPTKFFAQFHPWGQDFIPKEIILKLLDPCPATRLTIQQLVDTPWYNEMMTIPS